MRLINYTELIYSIYGELNEYKPNSPSRIDFIKNNIPVDTIGIEVGVAGGKHAQYLWQNAKPKKLYLIDHWDLAQKPYFGEETLYWYNQVLKFSQDKNIEVIKDDTVNASKRFDDESIDWIYLDADHSYEGVLRDLNVYWPKLKDGGLLMGDDYSLYDLTRSRFGVEKALKEFFSDDTSIHLEVQGISNTKKDINGKPIVSYTYKIVK